jgi:hypothetical protein
MYLLIGNGFSINIWKDFNYSSLYDNQVNSLEIEGNRLFDELRTTNFEYVLESIKKAININKIFNNEVTGLIFKKFPIDDAFF